MNKKILLLTTIYPAPDLKYGTSAIHYFTREWIKMGHIVKVIHYQAVYPVFFYIVAKLFRDIIASRTGSIVFTKRDKLDKRYNLDGVIVDRFPIFKWVPHGRFSKKVFREQIAKIIKTNKEDNFVPEIIIGHFSNPQLKIVYELKKIYSARTCMIMHDVGNSIMKTYRYNYKQLMSAIDIWGYRSLLIKKGFEKKFGKQERSFMCYSGIPEKYILQTIDRNFSGRFRRFVYVGEMIQRKYPEALVNAINEVYTDKDFHITYIGKGGEEQNIKSLINSLKISDCVSLLRQISRDEVLKKLDESDCMIMISKNETFGLAYLEAMGRGCITIGSKNEGIDGIIKNGVNGFLCEAGNASELCEIIKKINALTTDEKERISKNAIATVRELTDFKVAEDYINAVNY